MAVRGMEMSKNPGEFVVQSVCYPELNLPETPDPSSEW